MGSNEEKKALVEVSNNLPAIQTVEDLERLGKMFELSGLFGCSQQGQGAVLVMTCLSEYISPVEFAKTYHIIDGNISMKADAMLAKFVERGGKFQVLERSETRAAALFTKGQNKLEVEFTMEEAVRRNLTISKKGKEKTSWKDNPKQMLWARLASDTVRVLDPGVNFGVYTPEEVTDFSDPPKKDLSHLDSFGYEKCSVSEIAEIEEDIKNATQAQAASEFPKGAPFPIEKPASIGASEIDYNIIPFGKLKGKQWIELTREQLQASATIDRPEMTDAHREVIGRILKTKDPEENAA